MTDRKVGNPDHSWGVRHLTPTEIGPLSTWDHYAEEHVDLPTDSGSDDIDFEPHEALIGTISRALASADGLIFDEVCGYDDPNGLDECDSDTCVSAHYEDHDAEWARSVYRRAALHWVLPLILSEREQAKAEGVRIGLEAAANLCNERGVYEQDGFGLTRATQNYYRARDAIRALDLEQIIKEASNG